MGLLGLWRSVSWLELGHGEATPADLRRVLREQFGFHRFRPGQRRAAELAVNGQDTLVVMPTGSGKSLCFQLPAVVSFGITLVISPLLALMHNQTSILRATGVRVEVLSGETNYAQREEIFADLKSGHPMIRLLYTTPESCRSERFRTVLKTVHGQGELARVVIDEAHCVRYVQP